MKYPYTLQLAIACLLIAWAPPAISETQAISNPAYFALAKAHNVHLVYSGVTVQHLRLGNYMATRAGRAGRLRFEVDLALDHEGTLLVKERRFYINGQQLGKKPVYINGRLLGNDPYVGGFPIIYSYGILRDASSTPRLGISDMLSGLSTDRPYHDTWAEPLVKHYKLQNEESVQPNESVMNVLGHRLHVARMMCYSYGFGHPISQEDVWVDDSVPGRIARFISQHYSDDGTPGDRCDFSLVAASVR
jgi:hypothetical protein